jgi:hypothetical protein
MVLFLGRVCLVSGSIVKAAAEGKRLRVIDAFRQPGIVRPKARKTACLPAFAAPLTSRLVFALGFGGGIRLGGLRCRLVAGGSGFGSRLLV